MADQNVRKQLLPARYRPTRRRGQSRRLAGEAERHVGHELSAGRRELGEEASSRL
ncbi:hypothetical protein GS426_20170 [Rhodococcus hoagii]|nr:hypothetical protein [Prescottella equi]